MHNLDICPCQWSSWRDHLNAFQRKVFECPEESELAEYTMYLACEYNAKEVVLERTKGSLLSKLTNKSLGLPLL